MTKVTAIGFFKDTKEMPLAQDMIQIYDEMVRVFSMFGLSATHFAADDGAGRCTFKKYGGAFHKRVLGNGAKEYQGLVLAAAPEDSKEPGYDKFFDFHFSFSPEGERVSVSLVGQEPYLFCGDAQCDDLVSRLAQLWAWDYGFGIQREVAEDVGVYLVGGGSSRHSQEDNRRGQLWYACYQPEERRKHIRDIFPYNMIGPQHLSHKLPDGRSLRTFIETEPDSELRPLADNLWLWKVKPNRTEAIREKLRGTGIVITE